jgi:hypothetical protein
LEPLISIPMLVAVCVLTFLFLVIFLWSTCGVITNWMLGQGPLVLDEVFLW